MSAPSIRQHPDLPESPTSSALVGTPVDDADARTSPTTDNDQGDQLRNGHASIDGDTADSGIAPDPAATEPVVTVTEGKSHRKGRWWRLAALIGGLALLLVAGGTGLAGWLYARSVESQIKKIDAFTSLPEEQRPPKVAEQALNFLVVGTDSYSTDGDSDRTDAIILVHLPASRDRAQLISIPRDTWTVIPKSPDGQRGGTEAKINAAYAWGGVPLMVQTVESFTGVRIDHVVVVDFAGFEQIIDAVGGIDLAIDHEFTSIHPPYRRFTPGVHHLDGAAALDYARQRKQFADGDFSRVRHHQEIISALVDRVTESGLLTSPGQLNDLVRATADAVSVDSDLSIFDMLWQLRNLRSTDLTMMTSPSAGTGMVGDQSVVFPDEVAATGLYQAVQDDTVEQWLAEHPS
jgi:LCP family protein required for cell wall assembly